MNEHIGLGVFGTFGQPYGYQQIFFFDTYFNSSLDLNTNALELLQNTELYAVKKELTDGVFSVSFSIYSFAKELKSTRGGTFIGTCVVLNESYVNAADVYFLLKELYDDTVKNPKNVSQQKIQVNKADELEIRKPLKFDEVKSKLRSINETNFRSNHIADGKSFVVKNSNTGESRENKVISFFECAFENFADFETLYFTFDTSIINNIQKKGILKIIEWGDFINKKKNSIKHNYVPKNELQRGQWQSQNTEILINKEKTKEEEQLPVVKADNDQELIIHNEHPDEAPNGTDPFSLPLNNSFRPWKFNDELLTLPEIKEKANEYNRLFDYCIDLQNDLDSLNEILVSARAKRTNGKIDLVKRLRKKSSALDIFIVLISIGIVAIIIFLLLGKQQRDEMAFTLDKIFADSVRRDSSARKDSLAKKAIKPGVILVSVPPLNPAPNWELSDHDKKPISKTNLKGKSGIEVVKLILDKNPSDIAHSYRGQEMAYLLWLENNNEECFKKTNGNDTCICSTLNHIASFKRKESN
jgi:hypothetical protein